MDSETKAQLKATLDGYLETSRHRKTSERYAILDAVCEMTGHFTIEDWGERLLSRNFPVSRATLYNTISLFIKLHIVIRHRLPVGTRYEICDMENNHCHQICNVCGKITEIKSQIVIDAVGAIKLQRFRREGFSLYIYGICSTCMAKNTRSKTLMEQQKNK